MIVNDDDDNDGGIRNRRRFSSRLSTTTSDDDKQSPIMVLTGIIVVSVRLQQSFASVVVCCRLRSLKCGGSSTVATDTVGTDIRTYVDRAGCRAS